MLALLLVLCGLQLPLSNAQGCQNQHQIASFVGQMKKLLSSQEAAFQQSFHSMKKQLTALQSSFQKQASANSGNVSPSEQTGAKPRNNEICPHLATPLHGRKLGKKVNVGHEVHFLCDPGFHLIGSETRVCQRNRTWSGQQPFCKNEVTLSNPSFSHPPRCTNVQGSYHCTCDTGFRIKSGICQDVDECELFQTSRQMRICIHECINTPGSYQCICPQGYILNHEQNNCEDIDECSLNQHNCSHSENCVNVYGRFRCVYPECPKTRLNTSYVKTSPFQCERSPCPMDSKTCRNAAHSISYHYLPLHSNRSIPKVLFTMSTTQFLGDNLRFVILGGRGHDVLAVRRSDQHTGELILTSSVTGPATLEAEVEMTELSRKTILGRHIFQITIFVSQYEF